MFRIAVYISIAIFMGACSEGTHPSRETTVVTDTANVMRYAKRISLRPDSGGTWVYLFGKRNRMRDTSDVFFLRDPGNKNALPDRVRIIDVPCKRIAALSSIYAAMLSELGCTDHLVAIDNIDYVSDTAVLERHRREPLKELARTPRIDTERTIALNPEIVVMFGMGEGAEDETVLKMAGIPVLISVDHLEEDPLGRAEWIKLFGALTGHYQLADSIFRESEKKYALLKQEAAAMSSRPTVFSEIKFSDAWYMPGGSSFMARLIKDAGGEYLWKDDRRSGSLPLSFEQVYARARSADIWLNPSMVRSLDELASHEPRYRHFKAFSEARVFNNNKRTNPNGYSWYWESGMIHPERILSDLILIFHKDEPDENDLYYYHRLK